MCKCYEIQKQLLRQKHGNACGIEGYYKDRDGNTRMRLTAWWRHITKKGTYAKHASYESIYPKFCPFCGQPLQHNKEIENHGC